MKTTVYFRGFFILWKTNGVLWPRTECTGKQIQTPAARFGHIKQNASYDEKTIIGWFDPKQLSFEYGFLGFEGDGKFCSELFQL